MKPIVCIIGAHTALQVAACVALGEPTQAACAIVALPVALAGCVLLSYVVCAAWSRVVEG